MSPSTAKQAEYLAALTRAAREPVILQFDVEAVFRIVCMLQLALRHPSVGRESPGAAGAALQFIEDFRLQVGDREPLLAELVELGNHPEHDR